MTHPSLSLSFRRGCSALAIAISALLASQAVQAANQTWSGTTSGDWATVGNWVGLAAPGATSGTTNGDTATFNTSPTNKTVTIDIGRNLKNLTFDLVGAGAFTIGSAGANAGNTLKLTSGGTIAVNSTVTTVQTINAPLQIQAGSYTLNASGATTGLLVINGDLTAAGSATLNLIGTNTGLNTVSGVIAKGTATTFNLAKSGAGQWVLAGANTYNGSTLIARGR